MRALEWRARRFSDPADRLQFLRRKLAVRPVSSVPGTRAVRRTFVTIIALGAVLLPAAWFWNSSRHVTLAAPNTTAQSLPARPVRGPAGPVWLVQTTPQFDLYSNGLRIEEQYATSTAPRRYIAFARDRSGPIDAAAEWRTEPAGIVYHTTESHLAPFEENQNQSLRRSGEGLLQYVSRRRSYHFVIDRFGRVFRVVRESDFANHAGNSVWADPYWIYINLNQSFFGVAFEARTKSIGNAAPINAAQVYAGRVLTEMLRARYSIPASNCVAHAQVSVNPANHGVGYHLDWASNLPFAEFGLSDNYKLALPSMQLFGFEPPQALLDSAASSATISEGMAEGWEAAETELRAAGAAQNLPPERYREKLRKRYRDAIRALRGKGAYQEYN
ncbi:MAG: peptidoglycan recognition family protein [Bryobacteraceae bacterium]